MTTIYLNPNNRNYITMFFCILLIVLITSVAGLTILALQITLTIITGLLLFNRFLSLSLQKKMHLIVAELFTPAMIWLLFGVGGIIAIFRVDDLRFYGPYDDSSVLIMSLFTGLGALAYLVSFRLVYNVGEKTKIELTKISLYQVYFITFGIMVFDWYMRFRLVQSGLYFNWVLKQVYDTSVRGTDFLYHVYRTISFLSLPLLLYLISVKPGNRLFKAAIVVQLFLIGATGSRANIIYAGLILAITYFILYKVRINFTKMVFGVVFALLFFGLLGPMIQYARVEMRADAKDLIAHSLSIPVRFFTEYLPKVVTDESLFSQPKSIQTQSAIGRFGSYMSYAASIYQSYINGTPLFPFSQFVISLQQVVPRFIFSSKLILDEDALILEHFHIGYPGLDANGTYLVDAFTQAHLFGMIGLMLVAGAGIAFTSRHLENKYGVVGQIILVGFLPNFGITGDSFGNYLSEFRNIFLLLIVLWMASQFIHVVRRRRTRLANMHAPEDLFQSEKI